MIDIINKIKDLLTKSHNCEKHGHDMVTGMGFYKIKTDDGWRTFQDFTEMCRHCKHPFPLNDDEMFLEDFSSLEWEMPDPPVMK